MKITDNQRRRAEKYIKNQLSPTEEQLFKKDLVGNEALKEYVALLDAVQWSFAKKAKEDAALIASFHKNYKRRKRLKWGISLLLVLGFLLGGLYYINQQMTTPKEPDFIYAALYEKDQTPIGTTQIRGEEIPTIDTMLAFGLHYLDNGQKKEAIGVLSTLAATNPTRIEYVYYYALALFKNEKYEEAYQQFTRNASLWEGTPYDIQAKYYAAGCSLKLGRYQEALTNYQLVEKNIDSPWSGRVKEYKVVARLVECCASKL